MVLKLRIAIFIPVFFLFVFSCNNSQKDRSASNRQLTASEIYLSYCNSCHGEAGKKGLAGASDLSLSVLSRKDAIAVVTDGRNGMVGFASILSMEEINAVIDYVETLKDGSATDSK